ncbi:hypothetical protein CR513_43384, partial [Mucuna pruriens]
MSCNNIVIPFVEVAAVAMAMAVVVVVVLVDGHLFNVKFAINMAMMQVSMINAMLEYTFHVDTSFPMTFFQQLVPNTQATSQKQPQTCLANLGLAKGATHHVTNNSSHVMNSVPLFGSDQILMGNGQGLSITSVGSTHFSSTYQPHSALVLKNLLHVPAMTKNLLSVSRFTKDNLVNFEFHLDFFLVKSQETSKVLLRGSLGKDGLYNFDNIFPLSSSTRSFGSTISCNVSCASSVDIVPINDEPLLIICGTIGGGILIMRHSR